MTCLFYPGIPAPVCKCCRAVKALLNSWAVKNLLFTFLLITVSVSAAAQENQVFFIGHNMTPSTATVKKSHWTAGNYALGYGITDQLFVAVSPWIWASYNTSNYHLKWIYQEDANSSVAFQVSYFDSFKSEPLITPVGSTVVQRPPPVGLLPGPQPPPSQNVSFQGLNRYQWTSYSLHALYSHQYSSKTVQYYNLKYSYYINDDLPYSIRMDPGRDSIRDQFDLTTLFKIPVLQEDVYCALEVGIVGANYEYPYGHFGASLSYLSASWLFQLGLSYTAQLRELGSTSAFEIGRFDSRIHYSDSEKQYYYFRYLQTAVHPEIQVQYNF